MAISKTDILEAISSMSVLDLSDLIKEIEEKFGVSAAAAAVAAPAAAAGRGQGSLAGLRVLGRHGIFFRGAGARESN